MRRRRSRVAAPRFFVTGNAGKLRETAAITGWSLEPLQLDLPEIQSMALGEIVFDKARRAHALAGAPVLVEDTGLYLDGLGGFPGPLVRWLLEALGPRGVAKILAPGISRTATAVCAAAVFDGRAMVCGVGRLPGRIATAPRGTLGFGWDAVFIPRGARRTLAQMSADEKNERSHRRLALEALAAAMR